MKENSNHRKSLWASLIAFMLGTSCCWISSLLLWIGGAAILGTLSTYIKSFQIILLLISFILGMIALVKFVKHKNS